MIFCKFDNRSWCCRFETRGFTLLEIMMAIFIFSIAVTMIFGSFKAVLGDSAVIESKTAAYTMGKTCMDRIMADLGGLHVSLRPIYKEPEFDDDPDRYRFFGEAVSDGEGDFSKLRFTASAHLPFEDDPRQGIAQIVYYVSRTNDDRFVLRRSDSLYPFEPLEENELDPVLCENVRSFKLTYYSDDGEEFDAWDSDSEDFGFSTPRALAISLVMGEEPDETVFETTVMLPVYREKKET